MWPLALLNPGLGSPGYYEAGKRARSKNEYAGKSRILLPVVLSHISLDKRLHEL
jgi:hypothetical protein